MIDFKNDIHYRVELYFNLFESRCVFYRTKSYRKPVLIKKRFRLSDIFSKKRTKPISTLRRMVWYMLRVEDGFNFDTIGSAFGMDHSSVVKAVQYVEDQINSNPNGLYKPLVKYLAEITIRDFCGKKLNYWSVPGLLENYHRLRTN